MANNFILTLDTLGPSGLSLLINGGSAFTNANLVDLTIGTDSLDVLQMKIWGDVDETVDPAIQATEGTSQWISYETAKQVMLSDGDGSKTVNLRLRDDVYNESGLVSALITLDETIPVVSIVTGPLPNKISKIATKDVSEFVFQSSEIFTEYKILVVPSAGASNTAGVLIPMTAGSTNMSATGNFPAESSITCQIKGADLEAASAGDGDKIIKIFVRDRAGNWSA